MAYSVRYEPEWDLKQSFSRRKIFKRSWIVGIVLVVFGILSAFSQIRVWLWDILVPGDPKITAQAWSHMIVNISGGESLTDSIVSFCQEIIEHA